MQAVDEKLMSLVEMALPESTVWLLWFVGVYDWICKITGQHESYQQHRMQPQCEQVDVLPSKNQAP